MIIRPTPRSLFRILRVVRIPVVVASGVCMLGWGRDGHRVTADVATRLLTARTREALKEWLKDESLADASTWADEVRDEREYAGSAPLHYVNIPPGETYDESRDCAKGECVVAAIRKYADVLRDPKAGREAKVEALKFLVHFVGDVHQPLHAGYAKDRGGNDIVVEYQHNRTNLHAFWDTALVRQARREHKDYVEHVFTRIDEAKRKRWASVDPAVWAMESFKLAESNAYAVPNDGELTDAYVEEGVRIVDERLAAAGFRLAELLNSIFDPESRREQQAAGEKTDN